MGTAPVTLESLEANTRKKISQFSLCKQYIFEFKSVGQQLSVTTVFRELEQYYPQRKLTRTGVANALARMSLLGYLECTNHKAGYVFVRRTDAHLQEKTYAPSEPILNLLSVFQQWAHSSFRSQSHSQSHSHLQSTEWIACILAIWKARQSNEPISLIPSSLHSRNVIHAVSRNSRFGD